MAKDRLLFAIDLLAPRLVETSVGAARPCPEAAAATAVDGAISRRNVNVGPKPIILCMVAVLAARVD